MTVGSERRLRPGAAQKLSRARYRPEGGGDPGHHAAGAAGRALSPRSCRAAQQAARVAGRVALIVEPDTPCCSTSRCRTLDANLARGRCAFEVRRLHDAYRYNHHLTSTHDQSEAMTTGRPRIAVMNAGRIEQLGHAGGRCTSGPRSEFTASFLGGSNIHPRQCARCQRTWPFAGKTIECCGAPYAAGARRWPCRCASTRCSCPKATPRVHPPTAAARPGWCATCFWEARATYIVEVADGHASCASTAPPETQTSPLGATRLAGTCRPGTLPGPLVE